MKSTLDEIINRNINILVSEAIYDVQNSYNYSQNYNNSYNQSYGNNNYNNQQNTNQNQQNNKQQKQSLLDRIKSNIKGKINSFNEKALNLYKKRITKLYNRFQRYRPELYQKDKEYFNELYKKYLSYDIYTIEDFKNGINGFERDLFGYRSQNKQVSSSNKEQKELLPKRDDKKIDEILWNYKDYSFFKNKIRGVKYEYKIENNGKKVYVYQKNVIDAYDDDLRDAKMIRTYLGI